MGMGGRARFLPKSNDGTERSDRRRNSPPLEAWEGGVRSFHALTMFLTDVGVERGECRGRRIEEAVGVAVPEVDVNVLVNVRVFVALLFEKGPLLVRVNVWELEVGVKRDSLDTDDDERGAGDCSSLPKEEPYLLFVGEEGREP